jgi:hypothetical protein
MGLGTHQSQLPNFLYPFVSCFEHPGDLIFHATATYLDTRHPRTNILCSFLEVHRFDGLIGKMWEFVEG